MTDTRLKIVFVMVMSLMGILLARLVHLQVFMGYEYARKAFRAHYRRVELRPRRGAIWDRHDRLLAVSLASDSLCADPHLIENPDSTARLLSAILPGSFEEYYAKLAQPRRRFTWIQRSITPAQAQLIRDFNIRGLFFRRENRRFYPSGSDMASILGFTGTDGTGLEGLEAMFERKLSGSSGEELVVFDALSRPYSADRIIISEPEPGQDLKLTLDKTIQYFAITELKDVMERESAQWGAAVVMDVHSGAILAMASEPGFNPHSFQTAPSSQRRNRCTSQLIEPGSTFKAITLASVLESGLSKPDEIIDCRGGQITLDKHTYSDWKAFGHLSIRDVIVHSSNVGTIKLAQKVGGEFLYQFSQTFGLGNIMLKDIPGSGPGYLRKPDRWSSSATASLSIGYGVAVTPLQLAVAYAAFANGGYLVQPTLLLDNVSANTLRIMNPETAAQVSGILQETIHRGTARHGSPRNYTAAGKTGTARRYDHEKAAYDSDRVTCVFTGFAPAESPRISVCVVVDDPQFQKWSSQVTAALFSRIVDRTLLYLGESPARKAAA